MRGTILGAVAAVMIASFAARAVAADFLAYEGKPIVKVGEGGTRKIVDGVDFWQAGDPPHRYQVLGTIDDSRHSTGLYGMIRMSQLDSDIAHAVHAAGGDGVILTGEGEKVLGLSTFNNGYANGTYGGGGWSANGSSFGMVRERKSHQVSYLVVKYLPDEPTAAAEPSVGAPPPR